MLPLKTTFERFRRLVHDLGSELHKEVDLTIEGADTELDKTVIDQLNDPLVHLIRNSMDHGIETPEARRAAGKPPTGTIHLSARHSGANVLIRVSDDGRGLDVEAVRARAIEQGLIDAAARLSEAEIFSLILAPGFSTAREVTDVSGRGVGMDVVRRSIEALRGIHRHRQQAGRRSHRHAPPAPDAGDYRRAAGPRRRSALRSAPGQQPGMRRTDPAGHPGRARQTHRQRPRRDDSLHPAQRVLPDGHAAAGARTDHGRRNRARALRLRGRPGARRSPDRHQEPGPAVSKCAGGFRSHHSRQRDRGSDSRSASPGAERGPERFTEQALRWPQDTAQQWCGQSGLRAVEHIGFQRK